MEPSIEVLLRWVVERTFGWLNWYRRLSKDYKRLPEMSEAAIYAVMTNYATPISRLNIHFTNAL